MPRVDEVLSLALLASLSCASALGQPRVPDPGAAGAPSSQPSVPPAAEGALPDTQAYLDFIAATRNTPERLAATRHVRCVDGRVKVPETRWAAGLKPTERTLETIAALHLRVEDALVPRPAQFDPGEIRRRLARVLGRPAPVARASVVAVGWGSGAGSYADPAASRPAATVAVTGATPCGVDSGQGGTTGHAVAVSPEVAGRPTAAVAGVAPGGPVSGASNAPARVEPATLDGGQKASPPPPPPRPPDVPPSPPPPTTPVTPGPDRGLSLADMLLVALGLGAACGGAVLAASRTPPMEPEEPTVPAAAARLLDPAHRGLPPDAIVREGRQAGARQDWLKAMRYLFAALLTHLSQRRGLAIADGLTNGDVAGLAGAQPALAASFWSAATLFEVFWYGQRTPTEGDFRLFETLVATCMECPDGGELDAALSSSMPSSSMPCSPMPSGPAPVTRTPSDGTLPAPAGSMAPVREPSAPEGEAR